MRGVSCSGPGAGHVLTWPCAVRSPGHHTAYVNSYQRSSLPEYRHGSLSLPRPRWFDVSIGYGRLRHLAFCTEYCSVKVPGCAGVVISESGARAGPGYPEPRRFPVDEDLAGRAWQTTIRCALAGFEGDTSIRETTSPWLRYPPGNPA